jgi:hypothetical protein
MKTQTTYAIIALIIVLTPLVILGLHYHNRVEALAALKSARMLQFISSFVPTAEDFAASQGGALQQLMTSHVSSEQEVAENLEYQKRQVTHDILKMTEPELYPGPRPGIH